MNCSGLVQQNISQFHVGDTALGDTDLNFWFPIYIHRAVVDHFHDGDTKIAPNPEGNAEAQPAHDGDDVALGDPAAGAVAERGVGPGRQHGPPFLGQLYAIFFLVGPIDFSTLEKE